MHASSQGLSVTSLLIPKSLQPLGVLCSLSGLGFTFHLGASGIDALVPESSQPGEQVVGS